MCEHSTPEKDRAVISQAVISLWSQEFFLGAAVMWAGVGLISLFIPVVVSDAFLLALLGVACAMGGVVISVALSSYNRKRFLQLRSGMCSHQRDKFLESIDQRIA